MERKWEFVILLKTIFNLITKGTLFPEGTLFEIDELFQNEE
ncbi:hypothetical protein DES36_10771 [Alkalibaculum bacchi]|uniref:Uncharacterized protein n=1 Tax=Alkalibaculum bacchi TaxID=645887 RepID=A0A366I8J0_9FIRM|nr:hypothetical protein [Alkalibaculum bacchi]RBP65332.1 hypothetical protein DES36_10771 [Alkalibaculum bacchi]